MKKNKQILEKMLSSIDFAIHETVLYLDGHPTNAKALKFYKEALEARKKIYDEYTSIAPVTANDVKQDHWSWIDNPWPWQND
ncbi:spore coat protein CotJB [Eubacteriales bacterium OttesenSCG-928-G02]|nr:spore coat protein CotJB [Eubacteriales bacterium OttesenSCG-928-G02]